MFHKKNSVFKRRWFLIGIICVLCFLIISSILFIARIPAHRSPLAHHFPHLFGHVATSRVEVSILTPPLALTPTPLFFDDFIASGKQWALSGQNDTSGYLRTMDNDQLILSDANHKILIESLPTSAIFSDFSFTTTFTLLKGDENDSVGFYLRGDSNLDHDYRVDIFGNNRFAISKELLNPDETARTNILDGPTSSSLLLSKNQTNTLTVMMKGPFVVLVINGTIAASLVDADYSHGQIALFVNNGPTSDGVSASFSSVRVNPAPDQLPGFPAYPTPSVTPQN